MLGNKKRINDVCKSSFRGVSCAEIVWKNNKCLETKQVLLPRIDQIESSIWRGQWCGGCCYWTGDNYEYWQWYWFCHAPQHWQMFIILPSLAESLICYLCFVKIKWCLHITQHRYRYNVSQQYEDCVHYYHGWHCTLVHLVQMISDTHDDQNTSIHAIPRQETVDQWSNTSVKPDHLALLSDPWYWPECWVGAVCENVCDAEIVMMVRRLCFTVSTLSTSCILSSLSSHSYDTNNYN